MFTTIAVLKSLTKHNLTVDDKILPFLPPDWPQGPGVDTITFRELLTHRAGFRHSSEQVFVTDGAAQEQIKLGIDPQNKQSPEYNNINFSIFRDLLPLMNKRPDPGPDKRAAAANAFFTEYVQREVFEPVGVKDATCAPVQGGMLIYPRPSVADAHGETVPVGPSACATGGWFITPTSLRAVLDGLITGQLLTGTLRRQMDEDCLGWDCVPAVTSGLRGKFGGFAWRGAVLTVYFGIAMSRIPVVIVTNSTADLPSILEKGLSDAIVR